MRMNLGIQSTILVYATPYICHTAMYDIILLLYDCHTNHTAKSMAIIQQKYDIILFWYRDRSQNCMMSY
jgi:hypothetical protein